MPASVYQLSVLANLGGQFVENVIFFQQASSTGAENPLDMAKDLVGGFITAVQPDWLDCLPGDYNLEGYKCKRVNNGGGPTYAEPVTPVSGGRTGTLVQQATGPVLVSPFSTGSKFISGRVFLPGITADDAIDGVIQAGLVANLNTLITTLRSGFSGSMALPYEFVVWRRTVGLPGIPLAITVSLKIGVQKRRLLPAM